MVDIFVGNLAAEVVEDDLRRQFGLYGEVHDVSIILDRRTGRSRGFAFVKMPRDEQARSAAEALNRKELRGRRMRVVRTGQGEPSASPTSPSPCGPDPAT